MSEFSVCERQNELHPFFYFVTILKGFQFEIKKEFIENNLTRMRIKEMDYYLNSNYNI